MSRGLCGPPNCAASASRLGSIIDMLGSARMLGGALHTLQNRKYLQTNANKVHYKLQHICTGVLPPVGMISWSLGYQYVNIWISSLQQGQSTDSSRFSYFSYFTQTASQLGHKPETHKHYKHTHTTGTCSCYTISILMCIQIVAILVELHFTFHLWALGWTSIEVLQFYFDFSDFMFGHIDAEYCVKDGMLLWIVFQVVEGSLSYPGAARRCFRLGLTELWCCGGGAVVALLWWWCGALPPVATNKLQHSAATPPPPTPVTTLTA